MWYFESGFLVLGVRLRFLRVVARLFIPFSIKQYSLRPAHFVFPFLSCGQWDSFQGGAGMNDAAVSSHGQVFVWAQVLGLGWMLRTEWSALTSP